MNLKQQNLERNLDEKFRIVPAVYNPDRSVLACGVVAQWTWMPVPQIAVSFMIQKGYLGRTQSRMKLVSLALCLGDKLFFAPQANGCMWKETGTLWPWRYWICFGVKRRMPCTHKCSLLTQLLSCSIGNWLGCKKMMQNTSGICQCLLSPPKSDQGAYVTPCRSLLSLNRPPSCNYLSAQWDKQRSPIESGVLSALWLSLVSREGAVASFIDLFPMWRIVTNGWSCWMKSITANSPNVS